jgi:hypothetical protein
MGGKKMEKPNKLTVDCFSLIFMSMGWQWWALIPFVDRGRAVDIGNKIAILFENHP